MNADAAVFKPMNAQAAVFKPMGLDPMWSPGWTSWTAPECGSWLRADVRDMESTAAPSERCSRSTSLGSETDGFNSSRRTSSWTLEDIPPPPGLERPPQAKTTAMMRNIPTEYTRTMLLELLDDHGFHGSYDMVYLPIDFGSGVGFGYAFVNFVSNAEAVRFKEHFQDFNDWACPAEKLCDVDWSEPHQGLQAHIARYRNSPVMHEAVADECKPVMFENGQRIPFPEPTKNIRAPRVRARKNDVIG